jgi:hypothetical protein
MVHPMFRGDNFQALDLEKSPPNVSVISFCFLLLWGFPFPSFLE